MQPGDTKNDDGRWFPFTDEQRAILKEQKAEADVQRRRGLRPHRVFTTRGKGGRKIAENKKAWKSACKRAGPEDMLGHDFRRSAVSSMVRAGIPEAVAMKLTGHKTRAVFEPYDIVNDGDLREPAIKLDGKAAQAADGTSEPGVKGRNKR